MKRIIAVISCIIMMFAFCACDVEYNGGNASQDLEPVLATITVAGYGDIKLELYPDIAPITVANFVQLASDGYYEGKIFHRVMKNFMIQGGSSDGFGYEGSEHNIKGEFDANGIENSLKHERGVISMARLEKDMDSASSQFFIVHKTSPHLDGDYAAFGKVISGMEIVDAIASVQTDGYNNKPLTDVVIEKVTTEGGEYLVPQYVN
ncbi:MAG: peptidylprolyl isomerase [Clostridia bacterium]|nr:peptidylprolyl isomerase [Clostridia bacterium]